MTVINKLSNYTGHTNVRGFLGKIEKTSVRTYSFQFNPSELNIREKTKWDLLSLPGNDLPIATFLHSDPTSIQFSLFLEAVEPSTTMTAQRTTQGTFKGVLQDIDALSTFLRSDIRNETYSASSRFNSAVPIILVLGPLVYNCVLGEVGTKITHWFENLTPSRATISLKLTPVSEDAETDYLELQDKILRTTPITPVITNEDYQSYVSQRVWYSDDVVITDDENYTPTAE